MKRDRWWKISVFIILLIVQSFLFVTVASPVIDTWESDQEQLCGQYRNDWHVQTNEDSSSVHTHGPVVNEETTDNDDVLLAAGSFDGPMDSAWPMYCHDVRHTGRSPYTTLNTTGVEKWRTATIGPAQGGPTIDSNGTIYIGSYELNAVYPNGTLKWKFIAGNSIMCAPTIAEDSTIYFGTVHGNGCLYALYPNGTVKWTYPTGGDIDSSPAIGDDGTIYVGSGSNTIHAIYPNGTRKWKFDTNHVVLSSPAIGADGTIYCGCHDTYLYALYPENGTMKWRYKTGDWIRVSPCIADDGTIYVVSFDEYLHAVYPNGTLRWKTFCGAGTSPTIGWDGTVYCGGYDLYALNPQDGSVKWIYDAPGTLEGATPCHSLDGTIYLGTWQGGYIVAINPNGTEQWRRQIGYTDSPPAIGADGTVYIGSGDARCLHAFGRGPLGVEANGPYTSHNQTDIKFNGDVYGGAFPYEYHWDFGDGATSDEEDPSHRYAEMGDYTATFTVRDGNGNESSDTATVKITYAPPTIRFVRPIPSIYFFNIRILPYDSVCVIGPIKIRVEASQVPFGIKCVGFSQDGVPTATDYEAPYEWTMRGYPFFWESRIVATAQDNSGNESKASIFIFKII
jgi:outer membrane protein assembly factor BamB